MSDEKRVPDVPGPAAEPDVEVDGVPADIARLAEEEMPGSERRRLLRRVAIGAGKGATSSLRGPKAAMRWMTDTLIDVVPHLKVRDLETLRAHYDGKSGDELAKALIRNASLVTAGVGATGGGIAAVEWAAPPTLLSAPVLIAAETVVIVAVEIRLLAELHTVYGVPVTGTLPEQTTQLLTAWARRRGVSLLHPVRGFATTVLSTSMRKELRDRLLKRVGRNLTTLGPLFTGAAVAAELNRRSTKSLGEAVIDDLRKQALTRARSAPAGQALPPGAQHWR